ncbi:MAG: cutinase family protein [Thermoleophilaceae bacterium]
MWLVALVLAGTLGGQAVDEAKASHTSSCADVTLVFARGSGQDLGGRETTKFFEAVDDRIGPEIDVNTYELGTSPHGGEEYPAAGIGFDSLQSFRNLMESDASWTGGAGGEYRASVASGVTELESYLEARHDRCPDELLVIGGYSQGAQTVGDTLPRLSRTVRDQVAFVALFGDPKLYLPEGRGPFPPACRGDKSPWRRGSVSCWTDNGILEARRPYLPEDLEDSAGSWCDRNDAICNNNFADFVHGDHGEYANEGAEIDEAAREIALALAERLPDRADEIDTAILIINIGTDGLDVAFLIDTTGSMSSAIHAAREIADEAGTAIVDARGRVALTEYRDSFDAFVSRVVTPLTTDIGAFRTGLNGLVASGGGDTPEALLHALMTTFNTLDWTPGATKAAVVLTDAGYHDPDRAAGYTSADVVARSLEIDPVNVYPVVPSFLTGVYEDLASRTSGKVILNTGDTREALLDAVGEIRTRPTALLGYGDYVARPGETITFDASGSYDVDSSLIRFEWDFDGDSVIDQTTTEPVATHAYGSPYDGLVEVRVHSEDGGVSNAVANVDVNDVGLAEPQMPPDLQAERLDEGRSVKLTFGEAANADGYVVLNEDGEVLARRGADVREIVVSGLPPAAITLSVAAVNAFGTSEPASVTVGPAPSELVAKPALLQLNPFELNLGPSAVLTGGTPLQPVAGKTIDFSAGGQAICSARTGPDGRAACADGLSLLQSILVLGAYEARFAGDFDLAPARAQGTLVG